MRRKEQGNVVQGLCATNISRGSTPLAGIIITVTPNFLSPSSPRNPENCPHTSTHRVSAQGQEVQDSEAGQERTADGRSRIPGLEQLIPDWEAAVLFLYPSLTGSVQLPGGPPLPCPHTPNCLYTWDPWLLSEKPGHCTVPAPQRPAKPGSSERRGPWTFPLLNSRV